MCSNCALQFEFSNPTVCVPMQFARGVHDGQDYAIKFFIKEEAFEREAALYSNKVRRPCPGWQSSTSQATSAVLPTVFFLPGRCLCSRVAFACLVSRDQRALSSDCSYNP